jgi:hypothetical protein
MRVALDSPFVPGKIARKETLRKVRGSGTKPADATDKKTPGDLVPFAFAALSSLQLKPWR